MSLLVGENLAQRCGASRTCGTGGLSEHAVVNFGLVFLTLFMSVGANLDEGFIARLGFHPDVLKAALAAFAITGLVVHWRLLAIAPFVLLTIGANLPADVAARMGYDPDVMLAALVTLVLTPRLRNHFD